MSEAQGKNWIRARFYATEGDARPVKWPPPGPFWCSGYRCGGDVDEAVVVAYVKKRAQVEEFWPDAVEVDAEDSELTFSDRFPKPDWYEARAQKEST